MVWEESELELKPRRVDLQRFAYDVFVHSASKFMVPSSCIFKWPGAENDYVTTDFIKVVSRLILRQQIYSRYEFYLAFNHFHSDLKKLNSFKDVKDMWLSLFSWLGRFIKSDIIEKVEFSLALTNELILFLYAINSTLYLKQLCLFWFSWIREHQTKFEEAGGLGTLYRRNSKPTFKLLDGHCERFIAKFFPTYESSVQLGDGIQELFYKYGLQHSGEIGPQKLEVDHDLPLAICSEMLVPPLDSRLNEIRKTYLQADVKALPREKISDAKAPASAVRVRTKGRGRPKPSSPEPAYPYRQFILDNQGFSKAKLKHFETIHAKFFGVKDENLSKDDSSGSEEGPNKGKEPMDVSEASGSLKRPKIANQGQCEELYDRDGGRTRVFVNYWEDVGREFAPRRKRTDKSESQKLSPKTLGTEAMAEGSEAVAEGSEAVAEGSEASGLKTGGKMNTLN